MRVCVSGGAGFIGSHVVDLLLAEGHKVRVVDNFRSGRREFIRMDGMQARTKNYNNYIELHEGSILDPEVLIPAFDGCDWIIHMAANAEGRRGLVRPSFDLEQNTLGTAAVLEAMRAVGVSKIFYASSGSVYGNTRMDKIPEDCPFPTQTSLYGASKIAGEGLIGAYVEAYGYTGIIGRWMQAIGERYLHGHVIDFVRKLQRDPTTLRIFGDGQQAKSGVYVKDLAVAIYTTIRDADRKADQLHVYNIGGDDMITVQESAWIIAKTMGIDQFVLDLHGETWPGDNPYTWLDSTRIRQLGWQPTVPVSEAITRTVQYLLSPDCRYL